MDNTNFKDSPYSGLKLYKNNYSSIPTLVEPLFPLSGIVSLVGSSDVGKSTFLRQLSICIALGFDKFLGYKLNCRTNNVIYVSTEDDPNSISIGFKKQVANIQSDIDEEKLNNLLFLFNPEELHKKLESILEKTPVDLIVIDTFTDVFSGEINASTKVREFLKIYSAIALKYNCLILFLHHTGKGSEKKRADKNNVLGSQGFEAKMRSVIELRKHHREEQKRFLHILKGNYISSKEKSTAKVIEFNEESLLFLDEGQSINVSALQNQGIPEKDLIIPIIIEYKKKGISLRKMSELLKEQGYNVGKTTLSNWIKEYESEMEISKSSYDDIDLSEDTDNDEDAIKL
ncbi:AAA family ATPase [Mesoflavibacter sp. CH_XMU1422-2]|uniref:AAA family ATPase n=1 Tax=Mesoflavibacter sp. CH_XMU1422-2 TaxID=3107770 RepID=UPI003008D706